jgi:colicin import membrane protein
MRLIVTALMLVALAACTTSSPTYTKNTLPSIRQSEPYGIKVARAIKRNIVLSEPIEGNPEAFVTITTAPDGLITKIVIARSSGNAAWDQAVTRALDRTERLPLDDDGKAPQMLQISFRPKER